MKYSNQQLRALLEIEKFLKSNEQIFFLKGYAGTGKTTIIKKICEDNKNIKLLASTGRAAKIMFSKTGIEANTIHKEIFSNFKISKLKNGLFQISASPNNTLVSNTIYIIDEASMIGNINSDKNILEKKEIIFGNEKLLENIINILLVNKNKIIFVGDPLQLPPVNNKNNIVPALDKNYIFNNYGIKANEIILTSIERQNTNNGIVKNSLNIRNILDNGLNINNYSLEFNSEVLSISSKEGISLYLNDLNNNLIICKSNKKTLEYSYEVRKQLNYKNILENKDLLLVIKNNSKYNLMNGELIKIQKILTNTIEKISVSINSECIELTFLDAIISYEEKEIRIKMLLNFLTDIDYPNNNSIIQSALIKLVEINLNRIPTSEDLLNNEYYNSIQVRYGYALTCHKAQGGEAKHVFIDNVNIVSEADLKWLYTAITRATEKCFFIMNNNIENLNNKLNFNTKPNYESLNLIQSLILEKEKNINKNNNINYNYMIIDWLKVFKLHK